MALRDFNFYKGDLVIKDERVDTDDFYHLDTTITDRLKTLIYKILIYEDVLKNKFLGERITDHINLEERIKKFCFDQFYVYYPLDDLTFLVSIECLIIDQTANIYFYYLNSDGKIVLLVDYEMIL